MLHLIYDVTINDVISKKSDILKNRPLLAISGTVSISQQQIMSLFEFLKFRGGVEIFFDSKKYLLTNHRGIRQIWRPLKKD